MTSEMKPGPARPLPEAIRRNFQTMVRAAKAGDLALMDGREDEGLERFAAASKELDGIKGNTWEETVAYLLEQHPEAAERHLARWLGSRAEFLMA